MGIGGDGSDDEGEEGSLGLVENGRAGRGVWFAFSREWRSRTEVSAALESQKACRKRLVKLFLGGMCLRTRRADLDWLIMNCIIRVEVELTITQSMA